ncbi:uncharacterized protein [Phyllobates terribilis]|uniref:uncharacterized protein n=1 Tax=Phyllobates terribilis TaxID=111132 RepID=UPI003CCA9703
MRQDWGSHLSKVQTIFNALRKAQFSINLKKCAMGMEEARYFGYVIGRGVIKPPKNKIDAIRGWPQPLSKKQVRAFLDIVGNYCQFIPNFAMTAAPLTDVLKGIKLAKAKWSPETEMAFQELKQLCVNSCCW